MFPRIKQFKKWSLPAKWSFVGGVVGLVSLILAAISLTADSFLSEQVADTCEPLQAPGTLSAAFKDRKERLANAYVELTENGNFLRNWIAQCNAHYSDWCEHEVTAGTVSTAALSKLTINDLKYVEQEAFGENIGSLVEEYIVIGQYFDRAMYNPRTDKPKVADELNAFDFYLINEFLRWYFQLPLQHAFSECERQKLPEPPSDELEPVPGVSFAMKSYYFNGQSVTNFRELLGYLD